ncbi:hypothetical protein PGT21_020369 [Puccinia graminis f. sp. tritici]|uniref:Uncharacterized protein n=1 Tax=Puccinia graminis f. sp. tritici TaxID=56615 RepID=A0A5B0PPM6_PUCGR|nr:hypothetical protein PGT21_020369 [Puccinia graminis f. sp. tritici]KAA1102623.1 hypothetical protein PGTUg99_024963 [Puccinia graminis f. sp. tritici]
MFGCTFNVNHHSISNFRLSFSESEPVHQDKMYGRFLVTCLLIMTSNAWCSAIRRHFSHRSRNYASGEARYYEVATGAQTACGGYHTSSQAICAAGASVFGQGHRCGKSLVIYYGSKHVNVHHVQATPSIYPPPSSRHLHHYLRECCKFTGNLFEAKLLHFTKLRN